MRLINADDLIKEISELEISEQSKIFSVNMLRYAKTVFDIDAVIKELESLASDAEKRCKNGTSIHAFEEYKCFVKAIEIVKQGCKEHQKQDEDDICKWSIEQSTGIIWHCNNECTTYNQAYAKNLKILFDDFECRCPYCKKKIRVE